MLTASCDPNRFRDAVLPCDVPRDVGNLACANKALVASGRTVTGVGLNVLSEVGRNYFYQPGGAPFQFALPFMNPAFYQQNLPLPFGGFDYIERYPDNATAEIIFELDDLDLPSSGYILYYDGATYVSMVYFTNEPDWCSTVREFRAGFRPGTPFLFSADFNQVQIATGIEIRKGVQYHLFWTFYADTAESNLCIGEMSGSELACMQVFQADAAPLSNSTTFVFASEQSLYKLYYTGLYGELLSEDKMQRLHTAIPHVAAQPKFSTAFENVSRTVIIRRAFL